jgi:hypothetical protein
MNILIKSTVFTIAIPALTAIFPAITQADDEPACKYNENRSGICGNYHSEISPAEAFLDTVVNREKYNKRDKHDKHDKWSYSSLQPVIIDVPAHRSTRRAIPSMPTMCLLRISISTATTKVMELTAGPMAPVSVAAPESLRMKQTL